MKTPAIVLVLATAGLAGCGETVHDVEYYQSHEAERMDMITKCANNPGELATTPNCTNAVQAEALMSMQNLKVEDFF